MNDEQKARVIANCEIIAKALREGLPLQFRTLAVPGSQWINDPLTVLDVSPHLEYRIKPEPLTIWVNEYPDKSVGHESAGKARAMATGRAARIAVEYREVVK